MCRHGTVETHDLLKGGRAVKLFRLVYLHSTSPVRAPLPFLFIFNQSRMRCRL